MRTSSLVLVAVGLLATSSGSIAQGYPPGAYQPGGYPSSQAYPPPAPYGAQPYRGVPVDPDDDDDDAPAGYAPPPPGLSGHTLVQRPYETVPLPPPDVARPGAMIPNAPDQRVAPYPPLPGPPAYQQPPMAAMPPAGMPSAVTAPSGYAPGQGLEPVRPPGVIGAPMGAPPGMQPYAGRPQEVDRSPVGAIPGSPGAGGSAYAALPPDYRPETGKPDLPPMLRRQVVDYVTTEPSGTLVVDTPNTFLYLVLGNGKAMRYGIGVGREGFTWAGVEKVSRMAEWPDWHPPTEMIERQPYLPRFMAGGETNPLGARALYLGKTVYRIHGTNQPSTIGTFVSSGCIRLVNDDIEDLYRRVNVGTRVVVMPNKAQTNAGPAHAPAAVQAPPYSRVELPRVVR